MEEIRINDIARGGGQVEYNKGLVVIRACPLINFKTLDQKGVQARVPEIRIIKPNEKSPIQIKAYYTAVTKPSQLYRFLFMPTPDPKYSNKDLFFLFKDSFRIDDADVTESLGKSLDFAVIMKDFTKRYSDPFSKLPSSGVKRRYLKIYHCEEGELEETINSICRKIPSNKYGIEQFDNRPYNFKPIPREIYDFSKKIAKIF